MSAVQVEHVVKSYGALRALDDVSVVIATGELFFLLGPSGCGKTTLLRSIAGFVRPESGSIRIAGREALNMNPRERNTAMMFQSYALWPHMTVYENVAFGLKLKRLPGSEVKARAIDALKMVRMEGEAGKKPNQLSGGQQQRVALARSLVVRPACLLLDEPLSNLDAKLREEMRNEIRSLCKQHGLTGIYVTHDQKEALAVADRIAVMEQGRISQVGTPQAIYRRPANRFVADFMGQANLLRGVIREVSSDMLRVECALGVIRVEAVDQQAVAAGQAVELVIRPEAISARPFSTPGEAFHAAVIESVFLGELVQSRLRLRNDATELLMLGLGGDQPAGSDQTVRAWYLDPRQVAILPLKD